MEEPPDSSLTGERMHSKGSIILLLALLMLCGPAMQSESAASAAQGGTYFFPLNKDIVTLDPAMSTDTVSSTVIVRVYEGLVGFSKEGSYDPRLAESWEVSADGLTWTFNLRKRVKFHDGRPFTSKDVVYSFERLLDPETASPRTWVLDRIDGAEEFMSGDADKVSGIKAVGKYKVRIQLAEPFAPFLGMLAQNNAAIVSRPAVERDEMEKAPVGTGPFHLKTRTDSEIELHSFDAYWKRDGFGEKLPYLDGITFRVIKEPLSRWREFRTGRLHHTDIPLGHLGQVNSDSELKAMKMSRPVLDMHHMAFNLEKEPFKDNTSLRLAFNYGVDKEGLIRTVKDGDAVKARSYVPPGIDGYNVKLPGYRYNPERARQLLRQAGYPGGRGLPKITLYADTDEDHRKVAEYVINDLKRLGIEIELKTLEWGAFLDATYNGEAAFFQNTWLADYPDPENFLYVLLHSSMWGSAGNQTRYGNDEFDEYCEEAGVITDWEKRIELYRQAEEIAYEDAPWLLLYFRNCTILKQPEVKGLTLSPLDRAPVLPGVDLREVRIDG